MNSLKIALSALAFAALVTAPAAAKSRTQSQVPAYSNNTLYGEGHVPGTDPDPRVRSEILRDGNAAYVGNN
jgi:hypothetical protein